MRLLICSLLAVLVLALTGCGGSSSSSTGSSSSSTALTGQSTCTDWNGATASDKNAYLKTKDIETGKGSPGDAISAWMDNLCGKTNPSTSYSTLTAIDDVFPTAQQQFTTGPTYPPVANKTKTAN